MINNDDRERLATDTRRTYRDSPRDGRAAWLDVVDYLWQEFTTMALDQLHHTATTPEPDPPEWDEHGGIPDDLRGLAAREAGAYPNGIGQNPEALYSQVRTLEGTVSGLRAELAATLRRLEYAADEAARNRHDYLTQAEATTTAMGRAQDLEQQREELNRIVATLVEACNDRRREAEAYQETARQAADRLGAIQRVLEGPTVPGPFLADPDEVTGRTQY